MRNSKQFEKDLQLKNFDDLENEYQEAKKFFSEFHGKMPLDDVAKQFPCFYLSEETNGKAVLCLKYPTFAIRIINNKMKYNKIQELLSPEQNFFIYDESNVFLLPDFIPVQSTAILCLYTDLLDNIKLAEKIQRILQAQGIKTERCVASAYYSFPIKVDDGFFEIIHAHE